jgi:hypothetical protein
MNLASSSRLSAAAALPTDRPIRNARVPQAIGQSFDWLVPAEAEVLGARVADRPAAFPLAELEQRACADTLATHLTWQAPHRPQLEASACAKLGVRMTGNNRIIIYGREPMGAPEQKRACR